MFLQIGQLVVNPNSRRNKGYNKPFLHIITPQRILAGSLEIPIHTPNSDRDCGNSDHSYG